MTLETRRLQHVAVHTLQQAAFGKAEHLVAGHDEVVEHVHVHQTQCALERLGQVLVGPAGIGVAAGVLWASTTAAALNASAVLTTSRG